MSNRYDIAIIGTGPAGLSAALNAKIRNKTFVLFGSNKLSTKIEKAHLINNYLGFPEKKGSQLQEEFQKHLQDMNIEITEKKVTNIYHMGDYYTILANNEVYEATTIILATGIQTGRGFIGEENYLGKGVSYCATCDGALYRNKIVTVIAYSKEEEQEAEYLAGLALKVYYIPMYKDTVNLPDTIEVIEDRPVEIIGKETVTKLILKNRELLTDGVFILRDTISPATLLPGIQIDNNHITVDRTMKTNLKGCYAAGDIIGKPYQYIKAAGEGNIAALSAVSFVDSEKKTKVTTEV